MEDTLDILIYILISVVIFVFSAIGNSKKRKQAKLRKEAAQTDNSGSYFDFLTDDEKHDEELQAESTAAINERDYEFGKYTSKESEFISEIEENEKAEKPILTESKMQDIKKGVIEFEKDTFLDSLLEEEFDLKKAILYNEIINRKYD